MEPGYAADGACNDGKWYNADAGEYGPVDDPFVADGVFVGTDEGQADDYVGEGQPVVAVEEDGVVIVYIGYALPYLQQPCAHN